MMFASTLNWCQSPVQVDCWRDDDKSRECDPKQVESSTAETLQLHYMKQYYVVKQHNTASYSTVAVCPM